MIQSSKASDLSEIEAVNDQQEQIVSQIAATLRAIEVDGFDMSRCMQSVLELGVRALDASDGSLLIVNEGLQVEHTCFSRNLPHRKSPDVFLLDVITNGVAGWVIRKRQPYYVKDSHQDELWLLRSETQESDLPHSALCVPFVTRGRAVGAITLHRPGVHQFSGADEALMLAIADEAASHIENTRLFVASQRQLQIAALLNEASRAINSSLDLTEIMKSLLSQMNDFLNAEALSIALVDDEQGDELVYQVAEGLGSAKIVGLRLPSNSGLSGWVMEHCQPVLVPDTSRDHRFHDLGDQRTGHPTRAMICAPMQFKGEVLGTIQAINPIEGSFTEQDLDLLINLANIASTAIANAQQHALTQAAEAQYAGLFQDTINPIILTDLAGYISEANKRATQFLHISREELIGLNIRQLHEPGEETVDVSAIQTEKVKVYTSLIATKSNQKIPVEVYVKRTLFEQTEILQWILHDISKPVELEEMRRDLTAMLFHDLQSPLGNVISSLELLSYEIPPMEPDSPLYYMLDIAKRSTERLQTLIRSLLDINRLEAGHPITQRKLVDIYDLVDEVREIEKPNFEQRRVNFVDKLTPGLPDLYIEEDMIRRVLVNLIGNALKYSGEGQEITVSAELIDENKAVMITVTDQGIGVPVEYRQSIFEKFERIKRTESKGLGLGLAYCRLAVEAHDGLIWVEDAPGGGAQFRFTLPFIYPD